MKCPVCGHDESRVLHTEAPKRRRECGHCRHRWTTVEIMASEAAAVRTVAQLARQLLKALPEGSV